MQASTHTDIYRPYLGRLSRHSLQFMIIGRVNLKMVCHQKWPMLFLFGPPALLCIIACFMVYGTIAVKSEQVSEIIGDMNSQMISVMAGQLLDLKRNLAGYALGSRLFAILPILWYGAGLIAEDRRKGAGSLYFTRPLTRMDYLLGKLWVVVFLGSLAVLFPMLLLNVVAVLSSPGGIHIWENAGFIVGSLLYPFLWVLFLGLFVLCISSMVLRKGSALMTGFAILVFSEAFPSLMIWFTGDECYGYISIYHNFSNIGGWMLHRSDYIFGKPIISIMIILALSLLFQGVVLHRLHKMEQEA